MHDTPEALAGYAADDVEGATLWERRQPRISYQAIVSLHMRGYEQAITGYAQNISMSGIFVTANAVCDVGTELYCNVPLPGQERTLRGRVAWVADPAQAPQSGMGIEFLDLTSTDSSLLRQVVGPVRDDQRPVKVWFEGMIHPIKAQAISTPEGVRLRTVLPFLRLDSNVRVAMPDEYGTEHLHAGILHSIELEACAPQDVPRLQVEVSLVPSAVDDEVSDEQWDDGWETDPTPQIVYELAENPTKKTDALRMKVGMLNPSFTQAPEDYKSAAGMIDVPLRAPTIPPDEPSVEIISAPGEDEVTIRTQSPTADSLLDARSDLFPLVVQDPEEQTELVTNPIGLGAHTFKPTTTPESTFQNFWHEIEEQRKRRRVWLWLGAATMATVAVASAVQTNFLTRFRSDQTTAQPAAVTQKAVLAVPGERAETEPTKAVVAAPPPPVESVGIPKSEVTDDPKAEEVVPPAAASDAIVNADEGDATQPIITETETGSRIAFDYQGSTEGMRHYTITGPEGIVVRLPNGTAKLPVGNYRAPQQRDVKLTWVRHSDETGTQFRIILNEKPASYDVKVDSGQILVSIEKAP